MQQLYDDAEIVTTLKTLEIIQIQTTEKNSQCLKDSEGSRSQKLSMMQNAQMIIKMSIGVYMP